MTEFINMEDLKQELEALTERFVRQEIAFGVLSSKINRIEDTIEKLKQENIDASRNIQDRHGRSCS